MEYTLEIPRNTSNIPSWCCFEIIIVFLHGDQTLISLSSLPWKLFRKIQLEFYQNYLKIYNVMWWQEMKKNSEMLYILLFSRDIERRKLSNSCQQIPQ